MDNLIINHNGEHDKANIDLTDPLALNSLGFQEADLTRDTLMQNQYDHSPRVDSSGVIIYSDGYGGHILAKKVFTSTEENKWPYQIRYAHQQSTASNLAAVLDPELPKSRLLLIENQPFFTMTYFPNSHDDDLTSKLYRLDRNNRTLLNMALGSQGDAAKQAIIVNQKYIPVDLSLHLEQHKSTTDFIDEYRDDIVRWERNKSLRRPEIVPSGRYGVFIKNGLFSKNKDRLTLLEQAHHMAQMAGKGSAIIDQFQHYPIPQGQKESLAAEFQNRLRSMPEVVVGLIHEDLI